MAQLGSAAISPTISRAGKLGQHVAEDHQVRRLQHLLVGMQLRQRSAYEGPGGG